RVGRDLDRPGPEVGAALAAVGEDGVGPVVHVARGAGVAPDRDAEADPLAARHHHGRRRIERRGGDVDVEALVPQAPLYVDAVVGHADGEVPYAAVEGADGEGGAEAVAGLGAVEGALAALPPRAALEGGVEAAARAGDHDDGAGAGEAAHGLAVGADGEVG